MIVQPTAGLIQWYYQIFRRHATEVVDETGRVEFDGDARYRPPLAGRESSPADEASPRHLVAVAQLVERLVVVQEVAGSKPVSHPMRCYARG